MNRVAVVLGTRVYTTFAGRLGGVDERLVAEGRLRPLESADELVVERKSGAAAERTRRDPERLIDLAFEGLS
jgi:predicted glycosyltransferase